MASSYPFIENEIAVSTVSPCASKFALFIASLTDSIVSELLKVNVATISRSSACNESTIDSAFVSLNPLRTN